MMEESSVTYGVLFDGLKTRGLRGVKPIIFDAHSGLMKAIGESFSERVGNAVRFTSCVTFLLKIKI